MDKKDVVRRPSSVVSNSWQQLLKINQQLAREKELPHLLHQILGYAAELAGAECGLVMLLDEAGEFVAQSAFNIEPDAALTGVSKTLARQAIEKAQLVMTDDAQADHSWSESESVMLGELKSICCLPVHSAGRVIGCLYLSHRYKPAAFRDVDRELLTAFADQAGIAIDRTRELELATNQVASLEESLAERDTEVSRLEAQIQSSSGSRAFALEQLRSDNPAMGKLFTLVRKIMGTDLTVFIHGATGTGKEVIARCLHTHSPKRSKGPFVGVSCGAIPRDLMESELFGYKAGAFTGASRDKAGLFEAAFGGTLFLDEVAELPLELQAKLLRVIQEKEFRRLGDTMTRKVECRILSASHKNLQEMIKKEAFREDLYYRLCQIQLEIPPLADRKEDILMLAEEFARRYAVEHQIAGTIAIGRDVLRAFLGYSWPGNVRELENLIQTMCALSGGKALQLEDVPPHHDLAVEGAGMRSISGANLVVTSPSGGELDKASTQPHSGGEGEAPAGFAGGGGAASPLKIDAPVQIDATNIYEPERCWRSYEELIIAKAFAHCGQDAKGAAKMLDISTAKMYKMVKKLDLRNAEHPLQKIEFIYLARFTLNDYLMKIFTAALLAAGNHPYQAIRNLNVSPGYFYKVVPSKRKESRH